MAKRSLSNIYAKASDRAYMYVKSREGKTDRGLNGAMRFRIYQMGNKNLIGVSANKIYLVSKDKVQVPEPCLENIRIRLNKNLTKLAPGAFFLKFLKYPHQIIRHHGMATGAKADRISQGMSNAFGKPLCKAIRVNCNQRFLMVKFKDAKLLSSVKDIIRKVSAGLPFKFKFQMIKEFVPRKLNPIKTSS